MIDQPARLPSLTSLRWFAAVAVVLRHVEGLMYGGPLRDIWLTVGDQGATGVSFFFILSGFVLAWTHRPEDTPREFWRRRVARIVPAYLVASVAAIFIAVVIDQNTDAKTLIGGAFSFTFLQAWVPKGFVIFGGNGASWSLSAEAFFYFVFPFILAPFVALTTRRLWIAVAAALCVPVVTAAATGALPLEPLWLPYAFPLGRLAEFVVGICLCIALRRGVRLAVPLWAALALAVIAYMVAGQAPRNFMWAAVTAPTYALLIFTFAQSDVSGRKTILHTPALIRLGEWSFAFFLVNAMVVGRLLKLTAPDDSVGFRLALVAVTFLVSTLVAAVIFRFVEQPMQRRIRGIRPRVQPALAST